MAEAIKRYINHKGFGVPVVSVGKISDPDEAEGLLVEGRADLIGMARQLLTDPDWVKKLEEGRSDQIVRCIWCNVCKQLDENFRQVTCFLWPKGALQAPLDDAAGENPRWPPDGAGLAATIEKGRVTLTWHRAEGDDIGGYDIYRAEDDGAVSCVEAVKGSRFSDRLVLGGLRYTYHVKAFDRGGRTSPPSNSVALAMPMPDLAGPEAGQGPDPAKEVAEHA